MTIQNLLCLTEEPVFYPFVLVRGPMSDPEAMQVQLGVLWFQIVRSQSVLAMRSVLSAVLE